MIEAAPRILVIDDEDAILEFLDLGLSQAGLSVCCTPDGATRRA